MDLGTIPLRCNVCLEMDYTSCTLIIIIHVLYIYVYQTRLVIKSFNPDCIHAPGKRQVLIAGLDDIASHTQCKFLVQDISEPEIILSGSLDAAESARVRVLVFLDQMASYPYKCTTPSLRR